MKLKYLPLAFSCTLLLQCTFNKTYKYESETGTKVSSINLHSKMPLMLIDETSEWRTEFYRGENTKLNFMDITGWTLRNDSVFAKGDLNILKGTDTVGRFKNVLQLAEAFNDSLYLQFRFNPGSKLELEEKYSYHLHIYEAFGKGEIFYEMPFIIKAFNPIKSESEGITADMISIRRVEPSIKVEKPSIKAGAPYEIQFEGLHGLDSLNGRSYIDLSIQLKSPNGEVFTEGSDLLNEKFPDGLLTKTLKDFEVTCAFEAANTDKLIVESQLKDKLSGKMLKVSSVLKVLE